MRTWPQTAALSPGDCAAGSQPLLGHTELCTFTTKGSEPRERSSNLTEAEEGAWGPLAVAGGSGGLGTCSQLEQRVLSGDPTPRAESGPGCILECPAGPENRLAE